MRGPRSRISAFNFRPSCITLRGLHLLIGSQLQLATTRNCSLGHKIRNLHVPYGPKHSYSFLESVLSGWLTWSWLILLRWQLPCTPPPAPRSCSCSPAWKEAGGQQVIWRRAKYGTSEQLRKRRTDYFRTSAFPFPCKSHFSVYRKLVTITCMSTGLLARRIICKHLPHNWNSCNIWVFSLIGN